MSIIHVKELTKQFELKTKEPGLLGSMKSIIRPTYQDICAVDHIDFKVEEGEMLAFIGPNGAGKSTTIKMLTGILHPTSGSMEVLGYDPVKNRQDLAYHIGTVFGQKSQLWFHLPPEDSFRLLGKIYEMPRERLKQRLNTLTEMFELSELLAIPVRKMSLGQRIRCEIAASLLHEPKIIFLDEPTIGLDVIVKQKIRNLIKEVNREERTTIFLTSHDAGDIEELCKRVMVINHGQVVTDETVKNLKRDYLGNKVISIKYANEVTIEDEDIKVIKKKGYGVKVEVDTSKIPTHDVVSRLMQYDTVLDITIEDPPMEEIIAAIYQKRSSHRGGSFTAPQYSGELVEGGDAL